MADVFVNPYTKKTQTWSAQGAKVYLDNDASGALACLQGVSVTLSRQLADQYPIGGGAVIRLVGAPQGTARFDSLLGPNDNVKKFIEALSDVCKPRTITIQPFATQDKLNCGAKVKQKIRIKDCTARSVGFGIQSQGQGLSLVSVPVQVQFTSMQWV